MIKVIKNPLFLLVLILLSAAFYVTLVKQKEEKVYVTKASPSSKNMFACKTLTIEQGVVFLTTCQSVFTGQKLTQIINPQYILKVEVPEMFIEE
jgi:hypothetical protein